MLLVLDSITRFAHALREVATGTGEPPVARGYPASVFTDLPKLLERAGQRVKLTPHGAELLPAVSSAFDGIAAATQRMTRPASAGKLSISCVPALLLLWMTPRLGSFTAQYPDIQLTLLPSNDARDIRAPHIDVCVHYGDGSWSDCWMRKWSGLELFPVVSPTLINNRPIRTVRDLADHVI
ncbi:MAG: hypothetical protein E5W86_21930, partial [Mesorhizobium sp.]